MKKVVRHKVRLPSTDAVVDVYVDPKTKVVNRDGSKERPFKSAREMKAFFERAAERLNEEHEARLRKEREAYEKAERERTEKYEAERKAKEAERKAKEKELDDKIALLEVELTSLEKTYLETLHLFEIAQLDLIGVIPLDLPTEVFAGASTWIENQKKKRDEAKALATQLHHLRMAIMARTAERTHLEEQRGKKSSWESLLGGPMMWAVVGGMALWAYKLYAKSMEK